jgi:hypothetical protein
MMRRRLSEVTVSSHHLGKAGGSVSQDWIKPLGSEKSRAYFECVQPLETSYTMFSVGLNEAIGLQNRGRRSMANDMLRMAPTLCGRLAFPLRSLLCAMVDHAKHFGTTPNTVPLNSSNFQNPKSQRAARLNELFSKVLLTQRLQFQHKMSALSDMVIDLRENFEGVVEEICTDESVYPEQEWDRLDSVHYDLNTCLRETLVLYKSFLHALPDGQLIEFEGSLLRRRASETQPVVVDQHLAHRRMAFLKGQ